MQSSEEVPPEGLVSRLVGDQHGCHIWQADDGVHILDRLFAFSGRWRRILDKEMLDGIHGAGRVLVIIT